MRWNNLSINLFIFCLVSSALTQTTEESSTPKTDETSVLTTEENGPSVMVNKSSEELKSFQENVDSTVSQNTTISETSLSNATLKICNCLKNKVYGTVEVVNASRLVELLKLAAPANRSDSDNEDKAQARMCLLVLFYAKWCVFSSQAAPHFNALPRFFPHIKAVAIDASQYQNFNTQFGIFGVPTLMFIYNGRPLVKFNATLYTLEMFAGFVMTYTDLVPEGSPYVTSADFAGPLPSTPSNDIDYCLVASWLFMVVCIICFTFQSRWWQQFVELVQNTWRESNAQHEHID